MLLVGLEGVLIVVVVVITVVVMSLMVEVVVEVVVKTVASPEAARGNKRREEKKWLRKAKDCTTHTKKTKVLMMIEGFLE